MNTETKKRGRPSTGNALTPAQKQAAYRERKKCISNQEPNQQEIKNLMDLAYPDGIYHPNLTWKRIAEIEVMTSQALRNDIDNLRNEIRQLRLDNNRLINKNRNVTTI